MRKNINLLKNFRVFRGFKNWVEGASPRQVFFHKMHGGFSADLVLVLAALPLFLQKCRAGFSAVCGEQGAPFSNAPAFLELHPPDKTYFSFSLLSHLLIAAKGNFPGQRLATSSSSSMPAHSRISANS